MKASSVKPTFFLFMVMLILLVMLASGCVGDTYSQKEEDLPVAADKTPEERALEAKEEERMLEEARLQEEERRRTEQLLLEESRKAELGHFYVPLPGDAAASNSRVRAKGLYLTGHTVGQPRFHELLELVSSTELNAVVIDVKNDHGLMSYKSEIEIVKAVNADHAVPVKNIREVMAELKRRGIYPIARIVVFRDPHLAEQRPDWAIRRKDGGGVWRDYRRFAWVNPYEKNVWDYNIAIAREAALLGFREIQFDYIRFPENAARVDQEADYPGRGDTSKEDVIASFLAYAREQLKDYNVYIAADVFGVIATSWGDSDQIGQFWEKMAPHLDYICPMVYPSHYSPGYFGYPVPDANPAGTIYRALTDAIKRNATLPHPPIIRPWLQSFTATWVPGHIPYGPREVRAQIEAALALGIDEFMIWNAGNRYYPSSFLLEDEARSLEENARLEREVKGCDLLGRTAAAALQAYLDAMRARNWRESFALQATGFTMDHNRYKAWFDSLESRLGAYHIISEAQNDMAFHVDLTLRSGGKTVDLKSLPFQVFIENGIWRVQPPGDFLSLLVSLPQENGME